MIPRLPQAECDNNAFGDHTVYAYGTFTKARVGTTWHPHRRQHRPLAEVPKPDKGLNRCGIG
jgi:hypothetical protein